MTQETFANLSDQWWDQNGPLHTLHDINPLRLSYIQSFLDLSDKKVLDLGCGGGILSEGLAMHAQEVMGLDIEDALIDVAQAHAKNSGLSVTYQAVDFRSLKWSQKFDVIVCMELLEHVDSPYEVLEFCHRALKKNGYLFLSTINRTAKAYFEVVLMAEYVFKLLPRQTHEFKSFIKPSELHAMLNKTGFNCLDIQGMSYQPFRREAKLAQDVDVNYFMLAQKN